MAGLADLGHLVVSRLLAVVLIARLINRVLLHLAEGALRPMKHLLITPELPIGFSRMLRTAVWLFALLVYLQNKIWSLVPFSRLSQGIDSVLAWLFQRPVEKFTDYLTVLLDQPFFSWSVDSRRRCCRSC